MGKLVIEKWQCDRCKKVEDKKPLPLGEMFEVHALHHLEWAGGTLFHWKELCHKCTGIVGKELYDMKERAEADAGRRALSERDRP